MFSKEINFDRFVRGLLVLALIVGAGWLINYLSAALIPFFVAWVIAYLLFPIVNFLQVKCRLKNRLLSIIVTLMLVGGVLGGLLYLTVPPMMNECAHLKNVAIAYIEKGAQNASVPPAIERFVQQHINELNIEKLLREDDLVNAVKTTLPKVWNVLWSTAGMVLNIISSLIGVLYLFFMLMDYELYAEGWAKFVPKRRRAFARQLVGDIERGMSGYFRGQALIALSNCVMFTIGFLITGFPLPVALGCFIGIISFVPYLQVVGILPATVLALLKTAETGANFWWLICSVLLVYIVVQILQDTIFTPKIMGKIMGLPPAIILFSLSVWGFALGIVGLIIALPVTTLIVSYYKRYVVGEEETSSITPELPDAPEYPSTPQTP